MQMSHKISAVTVPKFTKFVAVVIFFFISSVNATILVEIRPPVIEWEGRHLKKKVTSVKHKPTGGIAMPGGLAKIQSAVVIEKQCIASYILEIFGMDGTRHFNLMCWLTLTSISACIEYPHGDVFRVTCLLVWCSLQMVFMLSENVSHWFRHGSFVYEDWRLWRFLLYQNYWKWAIFVGLMRQYLSKCWDKRPGRITVSSEDTILPIYAQKASHYYGRQFLKSRCFKTSFNEISLRTTGN